MAGTAPQRPRFGEEWLVGVLDSLSEGVVALDLEGRVLAANPAAERLLDFRIADSRYAPWTEFSWLHLRAEDGTAIPAEHHPVGATLADGQPRSAEVVGMLGGAGVRWMSLATHIMPATGPGTSGGVVVSFQDQTDRVEVQHELKRMVESLREFLSSAAHDLRSPLTTISAHGRLLAADWDDLDAEDRARSVGAILRQSGALNRLVADLSVVARLEAGQFQAERQRVAVDDLIELALDGLTDRGDVRTRVPDDAAVLVDPDHGRRMLLNLFENALKYGRPPFEVSVELSPEQIHITVADHGPGVPAGFRPQLFDRFTRASTADREGTGLGLAIVAGLAEMNGGSVRYRDDVRSGACFVLSLPRG